MAEFTLSFTDDEAIQLVDALEDVVSDATSAPYNGAFSTTEQRQRIWDLIDKLELGTASSSNE